MGVRGVTQEFNRNGPIVRDDQFNEPEAETAAGAESASASEADDSNDADGDGHDD
jgi:hypothetical protein